MNMLILLYMFNKDLRNFYAKIFTTTNVAGL